MRTKSQIKAKIAEIRRERDSIVVIPPEHDRLLKQTANAIIRALEYALGYKAGEVYWCMGCNRMHRNLRCPKCGNETHVGAKD